MTHHNSRNIRAMTVMTMFDHGGVTSYWRDVIDTLGDQATWLYFVNQSPGVDPDPFKKNNVSVSTGLLWNNPFRSCINLWRDVQTFKPDCLLLNGTLALVRIAPVLLILRLLRPRLKIKCVFHNGAIYQHHVKDFVNCSVVSIISWLCHENIFVSRYVKNYWWTHGVVLSRPFFPKAKATYIQSKKPIIGFLGRLSHEKDPELFLDVMDHVRKQHPIVADVAGTGPLKQSLEAQYPWATWRGWVKPGDWLDHIDLLVTTSKTEGWPIAIGEALEKGVPTIGIAVGGVAEIVSGPCSSWLTTTRDVETLAKLALRFLAEYPKNSVEYFNGYQVPQYTLEEWARRILT